MVNLMKTTRQIQNQAESVAPQLSLTPSVKLKPRLQTRFISTLVSTANSRNCEDVAAISKNSKIAKFLSQEHMAASLKDMGWQLMYSVPLRGQSLWARPNGTWPLLAYEKKGVKLRVLSARMGPDILPLVKASYGTEFETDTEVSETEASRRRIQRTRIKETEKPPDTDTEAEPSDYVDSGQGALLTPLDVLYPAKQSDYDGKMPSKVTLSLIGDEKPEPPDGGKVDMALKREQRKRLEKDMENSISPAPAQAINKRATTQDIYKGNPPVGCTYPTVDTVYHYTANTESKSKPIRNSDLEDLAERNMNAKDPIARVKGLRAKQRHEQKEYMQTPDTYTSNDTFQFVSRAKSNLKQLAKLGGGSRAGMTTFRKYSGTSGFYSWLNLSQDSIVDLNEFLPELIFTPPELFDLHCTVMYSPEAVPMHFMQVEGMPDTQFMHSVTATQLDWWAGHDDTGYLVLRLQSPALMAAHEKWKAVGAKPTFDTYEPHITLRTPLAMTDKLMDYIKAKNEELATALASGGGLDLVLMQEQIEDLD